ncbi:MAG: MBL fold metallo-hydrolase [SAR202 cluster bacterium]|nr:MBL fold metallo-hydrolase [Chloroflexota bacterium]MQG50906.1 MBL fold metallo-hydrolase [SAR202 cluster bacterium]
MFSNSKGVEIKRIVVPPFPENVYILSTDTSEECIVIDPGAEADRISFEVNKLDKKIRYILNTHGHGDHTAAVAKLVDTTKAEFALHEADLGILNNGSEWLEQVIPNYLPAPFPDFYLTQDQLIQLGDLTIKIIHTPGHTPGGVCFLVDDVIFSGDTLFNESIGRYDLPGGDGVVLLESIRTKLMVLPENMTVLPGHGSETTISHEKLYNPFLQN